MWPVRTRNTHKVAFAEMTVDNLSDMISAFIIAGRKFHTKFESHIMALLKSVGVYKSGLGVISPVIIVQRALRKGQTERLVNVCWTYKT